MGVQLSMTLRSAVYKSVIKPALFLLDPEVVHNLMTDTGFLLSKTYPTFWLTQKLVRSRDVLVPVLIDGIQLPNPVGLAAGFDYTGKAAHIMKAVGFGFNTVGTVTAKPYEGNKKPRLMRLPKSQSLLVNKGFKSPGAVEIKKTLDAMDLKNQVIGISVGSSNIPEVDTIEKAIADYVFTINLFKDVSYVSYFEINISCPNASISEQFGKPETLTLLLKAIQKLNVKKPIWLKMANELSFEDCERQIETALQYGIKTFIMSNLIKHRDNEFIHAEDRERVKDLNGNFSGKPTEKNANALITFAKQKFGNKIDIIGLGGIFTPQDAMVKLNAGATAVQLITGMIYNGPSLINEIVQAIKSR